MPPACFVFQQHAPQHFPREHCSEKFTNTLLFLFPNKSSVRSWSHLSDTSAFMKVSCASFNSLLNQYKRRKGGERGLSSLLRKINVPTHQENALKIFTQNLKIWSPGIFHYFHVQYHAKEKYKIIWTGGVKVRYCRDASELPEANRSYLRPIHLKLQHSLRSEPDWQWFVLPIFKMWPSQLISNC